MATARSFCLTAATLVVLSNHTAAGLDPSGYDQNPPPVGLVEASSAAAVMQRWYMTGAGGSWIGIGPGAGRPDQCTMNASQSCKCNGFQGNWCAAMQHRGAGLSTPVPHAHALLLSHTGTVPTQSKH